MATVRFKDWDAWGDEWDWRESEIYETKQNGAVIEFLIYDGAGWKWVDSADCQPCAGAE